MKESRFIELLNLYIDHQITPEEARTLEEEILRNPERRHTYRQYCRMQRACTIVLDRFATEQEAAGKDIADIVRFGETARPVRWGYFAASVAAAAAVMVVAYQGFFHTPKSSLAAQTAAPAPAPAVAQTAPAAPKSEQTVPAPAVHLAAQTERFVAERLQVLTPATNPVRPAPGLSTPVRLATRSATAARSRPTIEQFVFGTATPRTDPPRVYRSRQLTDEEAVINALQYRR
jgi:hypothetical protein